MVDAAAIGGFERREDAVALIRRRLCRRPTATRSSSTRSARGSALRDGLWSAGSADQELVAIWFDVLSA